MVDKGVSGDGNKYIVDLEVELWLTLKNYSKCLR